MSRQNNDPLALIPTIDDDSDVPDLDGLDEDDDDDEEMTKPRAHKLAQATKGKSIDFNEQFQFLLEDPDERRIVRGNDDQLKTRGQLSTIDEKIAEIRSRKKSVKLIFFCF
jgi:hypothetical protein